MILRERSETDRRQLTLTLTDEGTRRARAFIESRREFEQLAFDFLTPAEKDRLLETLDRVAERWEEIEASKREEAACSRS